MHTIYIDSRQCSVNGGVWHGKYCSVLKINKTSLLLTLNFVDFDLFLFAPPGFRQIRWQQSEVYPGSLPISKMERFARVSFVTHIFVSDYGTCPGSIPALQLKQKKCNNFQIK